MAAEISKMAATLGNENGPRGGPLRASELDKLAWAIFEARNPTARADFKKELAEYKRRLGKREEESITARDGNYKPFTKYGFTVKVKAYDKETEFFFDRPVFERPLTYRYRPYSPGTYGLQSAQYGLLANPRYNRDIRPARVDEYVTEMEAGRWRDLLSDPISITEDGHVLNGQHRIAAASLVDWTKVDNDPLFLVVWGVDPSEALYADGSRRTARDEKTIATKLIPA